MNTTTIVTLIMSGVAFVILIVAIILIKHVVQSVKHSIHKTIDSAGRNLLNKAVDTAFNRIGLPNASNMASEAEATPERVNPVPRIELDTLYNCFPEFNTDIYKLQAQSIVKMINTGSDTEQAMQFLAEEFKNTINIKHSSQHFEINASVLSHFINMPQNQKLVYEVAYKLGDEYHKDEVMFSNMAAEDISGKAQRVCDVCGAPYTKISLTQRRCEYCDTPIALETKWSCIAHKRIR